MTRILASERRKGASALALLLVLSTSVGVAAPVDDATRDAARDLAHRAGKAFASGDYATAQDLYHRAYALLPAPTLSLREARALVKLGRLVEAVEAYVRTKRTPIDAHSPQAFRDAVTQAGDELANVRPRVPKLMISVEGPGKADADLTVTMDGRRVPPALVGVAAPVDPGAHHLVATTAHSRASADATVAEGESGGVTLSLVAQEGASPEPAPVAPVPAPGPSAPDRQPPTPRPRASHTERTLAYVGLGVGVVGLGVGVTTGLMATSRHSSAESSCPGGRCVDGSAGADDVAAFRSLRTVSTIGYVVGAVGVGAGVALLLVSKPGRQADHAGVTPFVGLGGAGVSGRF